jgi:MoaA/NifB/PqqE/SkfB family radical SAM enzyme
LEKKLQATNNEISVKFNETSAVPKRLTDSQYVQSILKYKHLKRLTLIGGEPFLGQVAEHVDLLKNLNMAHFRSLEYITNGTIMPDPLIVEQWHRIPRLEINISVDGIGDAFEYLRYPGKWQDCLRAVDFYLQVRQDHPDVELCLMTTVSVLNVMALPELMDWAMHNKIKVVLAPLVTPEYYGIRHIPENARPMIYDAWQGIEQLEPFIDFMKQHPGQTSHLADTKRYVEAMDKINNKSFNALFPAYAKLLNITT